MVSGDSRTHFHVDCIGAQVANTQQLATGFDEDNMVCDQARRPDTAFCHDRPSTEEPVSFREGKVLGVPAAKGGSAQCSTESSAYLPTPIGCG